MSDGNSESRIADLEKKVAMMEEHVPKKDQMLVKKDQQLDNLANLYTVALRHIQNLKTELQDAKSIVSDVVAKSIGAKLDKKKMSGGTKNSKKSEVQRPHMHEPQ